VQSIHIELVQLPEESSVELRNNQGDRLFQLRYLDPFKIEQMAVSMQFRWGIKYFKQKWIGGPLFRGVHSYCYRPIILVAFCIQMNSFCDIKINHVFCTFITINYLVSILYTVGYKMIKSPMIRSCVRS